MSKKEEDFVANIQDNRTISSRFIISNKEIRIAKSGKKYVEFLLSDKTGDIIGRYFSNADDESIHDSIILGKVYQISGNANEFPKNSGRFSIIINQINSTFENEYDIKDFLKVSNKNKDELILKITKTITHIKNIHLKNLLQSFFDDEIFIKKFSISPAAMFHHHNYQGGLLEHTVEVLEICKKISVIFPELNKDLLYSGAILHDIGKIETYESDSCSIFYSEKGKMLDHLFISADMVKNKMNTIEISEDLINELLHLILSHHGDVQNGWGSAVSPQTPEAITLHHADNLDAKVKETLQNGKI
ncbi:3'-5' exoribonuclease YhaM family protein [Methanobacterium alcaliphilum]|uniref:3'-5' exoribonuclease YhaM family protein n=1 Tax=Methanobacterium alcaliphilum TaxID=392018 RepID=UPI00200AFEF0|nr:HD domain-containing protein [Methanobacterium alcaliphilum]MCK9150421.1 HD domain-containing protein [Methanobacterium alcaliphilum]